MIQSLLGCIEGDIRLSGGNTTLEGRVEICKDSSWGTVCDNGWSKVDAIVVCRQLNFSVAGMQYSIQICIRNFSTTHHAATVATSLASFGEGTGPIALNAVGCTGNEERLLDCPSSSIGSCTHAKDAGVICHSRTGMQICKITLIHY